MRRSDRLSGGELIGRVLKGHVTVEPDDASVSVLDLGVAGIVRFEVSMGDGVRVARVCFVHVLRRDGD